MAPSGRGTPPPLLREHGRDLRQQPALEHLPGAGHDRLAQSCPIRRQADHQGAEALERPAAAALVLVIGRPVSQ